MPVTAKAAVIHGYGGAENLTFEEIEIAEPGDHEVRVRNTVIGVNFVDVYFRRGTLPVPQFPVIVGDEAAGIVEAVGRHVTSVKVGDRVIYGDSHVNFGAYASQKLHLADRVMVIPEGVTDEQAAASFLKGLTARYLVKETVALKPGDTILYHAAAGGVGQIFVQWAKALGLRVFGTVSTDSKAQVARDAGCDEVINYTTEDFVARVLELTGGVGVNAVFDSVGKDTFLGSLAVLKPRGTLVQFGKASGFPEPFDPFLLMPKALYLTWAILPHYTSSVEDFKTAAADLLGAIESGILKVDPSHVYGFEQVVQAHQDLEERRTTGAVVMRV